MRRRWGSALVMAGCGLAVGGASIVSGSVVSGLGLMVFFLVAAVLVSPWAFPRSVTDESAGVASETDGRPIVYWRPGCPYCMRLRAPLCRDGRPPPWVANWAAPARAAFVRQV